MKLLLIVVFSFPGFAALANSFDSFVGHYQLKGVPQIQKLGSAQSCKRFGIPDLVSIDLLRDPKGYQQSHILRFNIDGDAGKGWYSHPIMEYTEAFSFAQTTGGHNFAQNKWALGKHEVFSLVTSLKRTAGQTVLKIQDVYSSGEQVLAGCNYEIELAISLKER